GELGVIGLLLALTLVATPLIRSVRGSLGGSRRIERGAFAASAGAMAAFALAAGFDWAWETTALTAAFMLVAAGTLRLGGSEATAESTPRGRGVAGRVALASCGLIAVVVISIPLTMQRALDRSASELRAGNLQAALDEAGEAGRIEPFAASPLIAQTVVYESAGDYRAALETAREAVRRESTNWQTWYLLARIQRWLDDDAAAANSYQRAVDLNPRSERLSMPYEESTLR
ncbi:MAG: tetratricopeptide repeat protein, partial [bacterium]